MSEAEKKSKGKGNILKIIIIVLLGAILFGGGIFGGYMLFTKLKPETSATENTKNQVIDLKTFELEEFLVNLKSDSSTRYLKAKIHLGYPNTEETEDFETELTDKKPILRDAINTVLRTKTPEDFTESGVEKLKEEIKSRINPLLGKGQIGDIYFSEILVQ